MGRSPSGTRCRGQRFLDWACVYARVPPTEAFVALLRATRLTRAAPPEWPYEDCALPVTTTS